MAAEHKHMCPTCGQQTGEHGHMCVPVEREDQRCDWCGALIVSQRHVCSDKVAELSYVCNSCGRTAVSADQLCHPQRIE